MANGFYLEDTFVICGNIILVLQTRLSALEKPSAAQKVVMGPCTGHSQVETSSSAQSTGSVILNL